ncbi:MAG TPA: bifunctional [glutamate--ammonia ligase]-adenylyl-L-tyrosine phosphorylase/[glutamate--ammonia-ligase] adenylyltransferase [Candidatus Binatia bacterium]|nr:bifunctional [glutamate--ammonia ligase]-adenylyl-L-tyrosine phosphorylase/[glutamate--ammonia-ligase] adenylyltransferase [Candidatus Binatia bacterium]
MTAEELARALADVGVADDEAVRAATGWLPTLAADEVAAGLEAAADPVAAVHQLARLLAAGGTVPTPGHVAPLLRVLGGSAALGASLVGEGPAWPALFATVLDVPRRDAAAHRRALLDAGLGAPLDRDALLRALRRHRRREFVRIGGRDLLGLGAVDDTVRELSALAEGTIEAAVQCVRARLAAEWGDPPAGFVVLGMGKLGGEELNYSSDVDLVYVYERDGELPGGRTFAQFFARLAEELTRALREPTADGIVFRVDLRLRPGGAEGPMAVSLPAALSYYETWGQTWERAVWLKARPVGGDRALGERLLAELEPFVYRRYLDFGTIEDLKAMKRRVDATLGEPEAATRNVKLGRGGIRELEFFVQAQQLVHAGKDARLRVRPTLAALAALTAGGYVEAPRAEALAAAYRFLRDVEHKIQIVHERQTHGVPAESDALRALARRLGFRGADASATFEAERGRQADLVHATFADLFHGAETRRRETDPALARLVDEAMDEESTRRRLAELGFRDPVTAYRDLRLLRDGPPHAPASARRRQALAALAPALLVEIARSPTPERALAHLATFVSTVGARTSYLHLLLENPGVMRLLVRLFATSEFLSAFFLRHPELLDSLVRADLVRIVRSEDDVARELADRLAAAPDLEAELDTIRRLRHEEFLRIGVHDIEGTLAPPEVERQLTQLAETCLRAALALARREVLARGNVPADAPADALAVLAMGKLGSGELNYASDLDLIFVYDPGDPRVWGDGDRARDVFTRTAQRVISALQTPTREGFAYHIDTRLRPSGNQGPLVSSCEAFESYHRTSARTWERQALIRARVVAGPSALRARLEDVVAHFVYGRGLDRAAVEEIARMRERIARERSGDAGADANVKTGHGGIVDVEFLVQMLQLRHGRMHAVIRVRGVREAIAALAQAGLLTGDEARSLADGHAFLTAVESRLRLERNQAIDAIDTDPDALLALARRLGYGGDDAAARAALRADHARHRAAIRAVYERRFAEAAA